MQTAFSSCTSSSRNSVLPLRHIAEALTPQRQRQAKKRVYRRTVPANGPFSWHNCQHLGDLLHVAGGVGSDATAEAKAAATAIARTDAVATIPIFMHILSQKILPLDNADFRKSLLENRNMGQSGRLCYAACADSYRCRHQADGYTAIAAWSNSKQPTKRKYCIEISVREHKRGQMPVKFKRAERAYAMTRTFVPGSHRPRG